MIELDLVYADDEPTDRGELWSNAEQTHVISKEDGLFWVRDENREVGVSANFEIAFTMAQAEWGEVSLAPANRLRRDIEDGDENDGMQWLIEYLAEYGTAGIDAQALARRVFERIEES